MATTGTFITDPKLAEYADEAVERAKVDPQSIVGEHIMSIRRSVGFILSRWANKGIRQWKFAEVQHTCASVGEKVFDLPAGTIDVTTVVLRRNSRDTQMTPMSRSDYQLIHDKNLTGRPDRYFIDRRRDTPDDSVPPQMFYWLAAENTTDIIVAQVYKQVEDPGVAQNTLDIPFRFQEAFVAELAAKVAQKYNKSEYADLRTEAEAVFKEAKDEDREKAPLYITVGYGNRFRR